MTWIEEQEQIEMKEWINKSAELGMLGTHINDSDLGKPVGVERLLNIYAEDIGMEVVIERNDLLTCISLKPKK